MKKIKETRDNRQETRGIKKLKCWRAEYTIYLYLIASFCLVYFTPVSAATTDHITQYGITWTFDSPREYGQFANGDYWVVGPVTIINIAPLSLVEAGGRIRNGAMINPVQGDGHEGYDNMGVGQDMYRASLNAARPNASNLSQSNPLNLPVNSSLVSSIGLDTFGYGNTVLKTAAILTVLPAPAPSGSFRPAYSGVSKKLFNKSDLDYSLLKKLAPVGNMPELTAVERMFERPWIDHCIDWVGRAFHPVENMIDTELGSPGYGMTMAHQAGEASLMLNLNFTDAQKETLLIRFVQLGIDNYGLVTNGYGWYGAGGHASGRKWPILFAGIMLGDNAMKSIADKSGEYLYSPGHGPGNEPVDYKHFGEDDQSHYVTQLEIDISHGSTWHPDERDCTQHGYTYPCANLHPYEAVDLGLPEWGAMHAGQPYMNNNWWPTEYRTCCTGRGWTGFILAARIMGAKKAWNYDAIFDYADRYVAMEGQWGFGTPFVKNMWDAYRQNYGAVYTGLNTTAHKRIYTIGGATVDCGAVNTCNDYPNQAAKDDNPCKVTCSFTIMYGDISGDGEVTAYDAAIAAQASVGIITLTDLERQRADVSGDAEITAYDSALIAQYSVGIITTFPVEE